MINTKLIDIILKNLDLVRELKQEFSRAPEGRRKSTDVILLDSRTSGEKPDYSAIVDSLFRQLQNGIKNLSPDLALFYNCYFLKGWSLEKIQRHYHYHVQSSYRRILKIRNHFRAYFAKTDLTDWEWEWVIKRIFIMQEQEQKKKKPRC